MSQYPHLSNGHNNHLPPGIYGMIVLPDSQPGTQSTSLRMYVAQNSREAILHSARLAPGIHGSGLGSDARPLVEALGERKQAPLPGCGG